MKFRTFDRWIHNDRLVYKTNQSRRDRSRKRNKSVQLGFEALEPRQLLAAVIAPGAVGNQVFDGELVMMSSPLAASSLESEPATLRSLETAIAPQTSSTLTLEAVGVTSNVTAPPNLIISEFVASNNNSLLDEDGDSSDWIEIFNAGDTAVDLAGWSLTDDAAQLNQWVFPTTILEANEFLIVFASGKDRGVSGSELHTNFSLSAAGEYLALVEPDGSTIAFEYSPEFPQQFEDVSFGVSLSQTTETLVDQSSVLRFTIPTNNSLGTSYTEIDFDDSSFAESLNGASFGFERNPNSDTSYVPFFQTEVPSNTTTVFARYEFELADASQVGGLSFLPTFDDGFIAYINGVEVASFNAPNGTPSFDSVATGQRGDGVVLSEDPASDVQFDLSQFTDILETGTNVLAVHALNVSSGSSDFLFIPNLVASTRINVVADQTGFFGTPTPGIVNGEVFDGFVEDVTFSVNGGFFESTVNVAISTPTVNSIIVFTTDGSEPSVDSNLNVTNGTIYSGPLSISQTTNLRAAAFRTDFSASSVGTRTYLFLDDIDDQTEASQRAALTQGLEPGAAGDTDFGLDPDVLNNPTTIQDFRDSLRSLPTISLTIDNADFLGENGIYTNPRERGRASERPVSVEYFDTQGNQEFQINAGVRVQGAASRTLADKNSLRLSFRSEYGASDLRFPLFGDGVDQFDTIVLRSVFNDGYGWTGTGRDALYVRDLWFRETQLALGQPAARGNWAQLYINGQYWGLYHPSERPDADFAQETLGGDNDDYDTINHGGVIDDASENNPNDNRSAQEIYNTALALANAVNSASTVEDKLAAYQRLQGNFADGTNDPNQEDYLDVENYIDYIIVNLWAGNDDWPDNNWFTNRLRGPDSEGFRFYSWDSELSLGISNRTDVNEDFTGVDSGAAELYGILNNYEEFRVQFGDRLQTHLFNDGALAGTNPADRFEQLAAEVRPGILGESARWGDQHFANAPRTIGDFDAALNTLLTEYFVDRPAIALNQFRGAGLYSTTSPVEFNQRGGLVSEGFGLTLNSSSAGTIFFTTDGSDPRSVGGAVSPTAVEFSNSIVISDPTQVRARVLGSDGVWSALDEASFILSPNATADQLRISEINYNPSDAPLDVALDNDEFEFIELVNTSQTGVLNLNGISLAQAVDFTFGDIDLQPGERILVVENIDAFEQRYGSGLNVAGQWAGGLSNSGEQLDLLDASGDRLARINYDDGSLFSNAADGAGATLVLVDEFNTPAEEQGKYYQFRSSVEFGGTPGTASAQPTGVVINEILANTDLAQVDSIELLNTSNTSIDVGGYFLSDDGGALSKFQIPIGTVITAGGFLVFDESDFNPNPTNPGPNDFSLSSNGEEVFLTRFGADSNRQFVDSVQFGATFSGDALGRSPDGTGRLTRLVSPTFGQANAEPRGSGLLISEFSYHPADPSAAALAVNPELVENDFEFVELFNATDSDIDLSEFRLRGQVDFDFTAGTVIAPGQTVVITSFIATDPRADSFRSEYGISDSVELLGGFSSSLNNSFGLISLQRISDPAATSFVAVDEIVYDDLPPFENADGNGLSLNRVSVNAFGSDASSWVAATPTPGASNLFVTSVGTRGIAYGGATASYGEDAIDPTKTPFLFLPGTTASFANYTNYTRGLNRVIFELTNAQAATLTNADFEFRVGNTNFPAEWERLSSSSDIPLPTIINGTRDGATGNQRFTIAWEDTSRPTIRNSWLQVTVKAGSNTGLVEDDVFYFGNQVADVFGTTSAGRGVAVNAIDTIQIRGNQNTVRNSPENGIENIFDIDRNGVVNAIDTIQARGNQVSGGGLLILSGPPQALAASTFSVASSLLVNEATEVAETTEVAEAAEVAGAADVIEVAQISDADNDIAPSAVSFSQPLEPVQANTPSAVSTPTTTNVETSNAVLSVQQPLVQSLLPVAQQPQVVAAQVDSLPAETDLLSSNDVHGPTLSTLSDVDHNAGNNDNLATNDVSIVENDSDAIFADSQNLVSQQPLQPQVNEAQQDSMPAETDFPVPNVAPVQRLSEVGSDDLSNGDSIETDASIYEFDTAASFAVSSSLLSQQPLVNLAAEDSFYAEVDLPSLNGAEFQNVPDLDRADLSEDELRKNDASSNARDTDAVFADSLNLFPEFTFRLS